MSYLGILLLLNLLILIHEAGRLVAAKLVGIPVAAFSVGLGPKVWSRHGGDMTSLRPFLSYAIADHELVERVAEKLTVRGLLPIYDHWWMRSAPSDDPAATKREIEMGVGHADSFVHFYSLAARQSPHVRYEGDLAMGRTCSDSSNFPMVFVRLEDPEVYVPDWFTATIDFTTSPRSEVHLVDELLRGLGGDPNATAPPALRACRQLADERNFRTLREQLQQQDKAVRREAAVLLACIDSSLPPPVLSKVVTELDQGLSTKEADRVIRALGKLKEKAAPAVAGLARFVESAADPRERAQAVRVLGRIGPTKETVEALVRVATQPTRMRAAAVTELGEMGAAAVVAVPALVNLCAAGDRHLRLVVLTALGKIGDRRPEVLRVVLEALAETERQGLSPSQLHHNAMAILNQLAPTPLELARALPLAHSSSWRFVTWLEDQVPEAAEVISSGLPEARMHQELLEAARKILQGCALAGAKRPF